MKTMMFTLAMALGLCLTACGSSGDSANKAAADDVAKPGSCREGGDKGSTCSDYDKTGAKAGKDYCEKTGGGANVWSDDPCPSENLIGSCERKDGQTQRYYSTGENAQDAETAANICVELSNGKWAPPGPAGGEAGGGEAALAAVTCEAAVTHFVGLIAVHGDGAMFTTEDIPELTKACEAAGNIGDPDFACLMKAKNLEETEACKTLNDLMKSW